MQLLLRPLCIAPDDDVANKAGRLLINAMSSRRISYGSVLAAGNKHG